MLYNLKKGSSMKKQSKFKLRTMTDIKIFLLFLLDHIRYPIAYTTLANIIGENVDEITMDYYECLRDLVDAGHLYYDEADGERYYMISETGGRVAAELYDRLDPDFRAMSIKSAAKYISLADRAASISAVVEELPDKRYEVNISTTDSRGKVFSLSIAASSRGSAERMKKSFEANPDGLYKGILFCLTGELGFLP